MSAAVERDVITKNEAQTLNVTRMKDATANYLLTGRRVEQELIFVSVTHCTISSTECFKSTFLYCGDKPLADWGS